MHRRSIITHAGQLRPHPREDTRVLLEEYGGAPEEQAKCVRAADAVSCRGDQHGHQARTTDEREPMSTITIDRLTKRYGAVSPLTTSASPLRPGPSPASSAPTAPASRRRCGCCWVSPDRRPPGADGESVTPSSATPRESSAHSSTPTSSTRDDVAETRCVSWLFFNTFLGESGNLSGLEFQQIRRRQERQGRGVLRKQGDPRGSQAARRDLEGARRELGEVRPSRTKPPRPDERARSRHPCLDSATLLIVVAPSRAFTKAHAPFPVRRRRWYRRRPLGTKAAPP